MLWHEPRLANTCTWSWGLYGINPAIALQNMTMLLTDVRPSTSWFIQTALVWFVTPCRVIDGCQYYGGTHCLHVRGLRNRLEIDVITAMMHLLHWHVMKNGSRNFSQIISHSSPTEVTLIYLCFYKQWLSLICHIFFLYFLTHTKHTYGSVQWFFTLLFHTCYWPTPGSVSPVFSCDHDSPPSLLLAYIMKLHPRTDHLDLILQPWRWRQSIPPKCQNLPTKLQGIKSMHTTCEKIEPW